MSSKPRTPERLYLLDALRGVAALAVVFWHWQHFSFDGYSLPADFSRETQPLFAVFFLVYRNGSLAVDLFFALSGFIFFCLYAEPISQHRISPKTFFVLRFSRLYPLHFCTMVVVAICQLVYERIYDGSFVYPANDLYHLVLNILLIPSVGLERGYSYNAPVWSVSVEAILYALFFSVCWLKKPRFIFLLALSAVGFLVVRPLYSHLGRGVGSFFLGGCVYYVYSRIIRSEHETLQMKILVLSTGLLWAATLIFSSLSYSLDSIPIVWRFSWLIPIVVLFPMSILSLALIETYRGAFARRLSFLGDISYSSYLWHFPLQLIFVLTLGQSTSFLSSTSALLFYFAVLLLLSFASFQYLERPAQRFIRQFCLG